MNGEAARHAEMNHQSIGTVGLGQKVFRPALQSRNPLTRKALGKTGRERHAKIGSVDRDFGKALPLERRDQAKANGFDFG